MQLEVTSDVRAFARLRSAWDRLAPDGRTTPILRGHTWAFEWWRALGAGRELRLVSAARDGEVLGILPLFRESGQVDRLRLIGSAGGGSDFLGALGSDAAARAAVLHEALGLGADVVEFGDLEGGDPLVELALAEGRRAGGAVELLDRHPCPFIAVDGPFSTFVETVARRDTLKRREKWLAAQPGFRVEVSSAPGDVPAFVDLFLRLHDARWRSDGGSQAFQDARLVTFQRAVCARFADEQRLRMWTMRVAGEPVAVAYGFDDDEGRTLYFQSGFAPAWGGRSVGLVLFARFVEDAFARGRREVDLLRGAEPYKREWTSHARRTVTVRLALTARGRAALAWDREAARLRAAVRSALPEQVRVPVTQVVRAVRRGRGG